ncbi:MAG: glycerophosphodiester phosphodiesterase [Eubacterium sp.]
MSNFTITAHSGAYNTTDNTMEYVNTAIKNNADIIEIDVRQRPDGTVAMAHDKITSNAQGEEVEQVLKAVKDTGALINLDIKETHLLPQLNTMVEKYNMANQVFMTGIEIKDVPAVKTGCPSIKYYLNYKPSIFLINSKFYRKKLLSLLRNTGAVGINCNYLFSTKSLSTLLHANGYKLSLWTVDKDSTIKKVIAQQPDNITTHYPDKVKSIADSIK